MLGYIWIKSIESRANISGLHPKDYIKPVTSCVILDKLLNVSGLGFLIRSIMFLLMLSLEINCLEQCLLCDKIALYLSSG